jgi:hypothetical protein
MDHRGPISGSSASSCSRRSATSSRPPPMW